MTDIDPLTPCRACGNTKAWHDANNPRHRFDPEGGVVAPRELPPVDFGKGDLVLRLALIKAGVITEMQLTEAETWLNKAREQGRVLMVIPDEDGSMQWRMITMEDLQAALGTVGA